MGRSSYFQPSCGRDADFERTLVLFAVLLSNLHRNQRISSDVDRLQSSLYVPGNSQHLRFVFDFIENSLKFTNGDRIGERFRELEQIS